MRGWFLRAMAVASANVRDGPVCGQAVAATTSPNRIVLMSRLLAMLDRRLLAAIDEEIGRRYDKHGQNHGRGQAADDGAGHGSVLLGAGAQLQRHGDHTDDGGERG